MANRRRKRSNTKDHSGLELIIAYEDISDIVPYDNNPRDNEQAIEPVARSISNFGFVVPIILDADNVIVCGHTRYKAAMSLGLTVVPTIRATHLSEKQIKAFRAIDNKVSELARFDFDMLSEEFSELGDLDLDFTQFGWTTEDMECLMDSFEEDEEVAGAIAGMERSNRSNRADKRAPGQTRIVIGEFIFFVPKKVYKRWASQMKAEADFDDAEIIRQLKDAMGLMQYETAYRQETGS